MLDEPTLIGVDFDKTLTDPERDEWAPPEAQDPNPEMIDHVNEMYKSGKKIIIWTARQWEDAGKIAGWLQIHGVMHHGIRCNKGGADAYIDDKTIRPEEVTEIRKRENQ